MDLVERERETGSATDDERRRVYAYGERLGGWVAHAAFNATHSFSDYWGPLLRFRVVERFIAAMSV